MKGFFKIFNIVLYIFGFYGKINFFMDYNIKKK